MALSILLIEDTNDILENVTEILQLQRYDVLASSDGRTGIDLATRIKPDLILCDIVMPEMDGYDVIRHLKNNKETKDIPVIMITSQSENQSIKQAYNLGASGYIIKPFDGNLLIREVQRLVPRKGLNDQSLLLGRLTS
jgi:CheY-like chemotaxis protein